MSNCDKPVLVVGAGPAGMMAAGQAALQGTKVILLERNERPGVKLNLTGKGRCNLTNDCTPEEFFKEIPGDGRFLFSALSRFTPQDTMDFFEALGVPLKTERGRRVFPLSDRAADITVALVRWLDSLGVVRRKMRVSELLLDNDTLSGVRAGNDTVKGRAVIVATGGLSYPKTGSTGDGYGLARQAGHSVTDLSPSLVPLVSSDSDCRTLQGLSLRNVTLSLRDSTGKIHWKEGPGEQLFTHFGISGPLCLSASAHWISGLHAVIDLKPGLSPEQLDNRIRRDFEKYAARDFQNALGDLLHKSMIPVIIARSGIDPHKKTAEITKAERIELSALLKTFTVHISGLRPMTEAVITRGGVVLKEVDPKTMESKRVKGLYFAGEVLDLDAYTGGYNLQIAWSTGYVSGTFAAVQNGTPGTASYTGGEDWS